MKEECENVLIVADDITYGTENKLDVCMMYPSSIVISINTAQITPTRYTTSTDRNID